jgi:hypothetical protein
MVKYRQNSIAWFCIVFVLVLISITGCALPMRELTVTHHSLNSVTNKKQGVVLVVQFIDKRNKENPELIGNRVRLQDGAKLDVVLTKFIAEALNAAGYKTITEKQPLATPVNYDVIVTGEILDFWMDFNPGQVEHKIDIKINAVSLTNQVIVWQNRIEASQVNVNWIGVRGEYSKVVDEALTKALNQAIQAFASDDFSTALLKKTSASN